MNASGFDVHDELVSSGALVGAALALGARNVRGWSEAEEAVAASAVHISKQLADRLREEVRAGGDPLGECFCKLRPPDQRRALGATYTPKAIVDAMLDRAAAFDAPARIVDPGVGSGRFLLAAGHVFTRSHLLGVEVDPLAAIIARASLAARGYEDRAAILLRDFRSPALPPCDGRTLFIGNPPYVRHHAIEARWKRWLTATARSTQRSASQLAGLHVHFLLATMLHARDGDSGVYVTAAEWLDVNYGQLVRELLLDGLGASSIHVIEPTSLPFADAIATAAITCFEVGTRPSTIRMRRVARVDALRALEGGRPVSRARLEISRRWTSFLRTRTTAREGYVELGELCRVHRGAATGANRVWIADATVDLPARLLFPSITRARELFSAKDVLSDTAGLRRVIALPVDLDELDARDRPRVERFLARAKTMDVPAGYIARHRRAWWAVELRAPAPILATYMARRPPAFVRNIAEARHINIAHGLYPREPLTSHELGRLASYLSANTSPSEGRTYAGGLTKFEPREMERLMVPGRELLMS